MSKFKLLLCALAFLFSTGAFAYIDVCSKISNAPSDCAVESGHLTLGHLPIWASPTCNDPARPYAWGVAYEADHKIAFIHKGFTDDNQYGITVYMWYVGFAKSVGVDLYIACSAKKAPSTGYLELA